MPFSAEDVLQIYNEVPGWGPHPDVPAGLTHSFMVATRAMTEQEVSETLPGGESGVNRRLQSQTMT